MIYHEFSHDCETWVEVLSDNDEHLGAFIERIGALTKFKYYRQRIESGSKNAMGSNAYYTDARRVEVFYDINKARDVVNRVKNTRLELDRLVDEAVANIVGEESRGQRVARLARLATTA